MLLCPQMFSKEDCSKFPILPASMVKMDLQFLLTSGRLGLTVCPSKTFPSFQSAMLNTKLLLHSVIPGVVYLMEYPMSPAGRNQPHSCEGCGCLGFPQTRYRLLSFFLTSHHLEVHFFNLMLHFAQFHLLSLKTMGGELMDAHILHRLNSAIAGTPVTLFTQIYRPAQPQVSRGRGKPVMCLSVSVKRSIIVF